MSAVTGPESSEWETLMIRLPAQRRKKTEERREKGEKRETRQERGGKRMSERHREQTERRKERKGRRKYTSDLQEREKQGGVNGGQHKRMDEKVPSLQQSAMSEGGCYPRVQSTSSFENNCREGGSLL